MNQLKNYNMKKTFNFDLNKTIDITLISLIIYCILAIVRSLNLLYIAYTDDYFYNFDFVMKFYIAKSVVFNNAYYFYTYIIGFFLSFPVKQVLKLTWWNFIGSLVIGFVLFRFIDSGFVRPLFGLFDNPRMNIVTNLLTFSILGFLLARFFFKKRADLESIR
jgi:hypothetical protein